MLTKMENRMDNKRGVSLMVSYVLLISIVIALSIGIFAWMKIIAKDVNPSVDCKEGTSVILESFDCREGEGIDLVLENNGRFSVDGIILAVGDNTERAPTTYLIAEIDFGNGLEGHHFFTESLKPGDIDTTARFSNWERIGGELREAGFEYIRIIQIQPFIKNEKGRVICKDAVIKQEIECKIN